MRFTPIVVAAVLVVGCAKPATSPTVVSNGTPGANDPAGESPTGQPDGAAAVRGEAAAPDAEPTTTVAEKSVAARPSDTPADVAKEPLLPVGDLIAQARAAVANPGQPPDLEKAIELLQAALAQEPKNRVALGFITECTQMYGMQLAQQGIEEKGYNLFLKSGEYLRRWREPGTPLSEREKQLAALVYYNEACAFALMKEPDKAIASLGDALDAGFNDLNQLDKDADLNSLRDRDDYKKLREQAVSRSSGDKDSDK
jgi:tetratricopeptide (TPR) repeat protein